MIENTISSIEELNEVIVNNDAVLVYFSHSNCGVCKVLKPKVWRMVASTYPMMKVYYSDVIINPMVSSQLSIFAVPTIVVYFVGKESFRLSRNLGIDELSQLIARPYNMIF